MRRAAERQLPRFLFDYLEGGAGSEGSLRRNLDAFQQMTITPRVLRKLDEITTNLRVLGQDLSFPAIVGPTGLNGALWPSGDLLLASAAASIGVPFTLSTAANATLEQVTRHVGSPPWFQLYVWDMAHAHRMVDEAATCGSPVLVLTVDVPLGGRRLRDLRNSFAFPLQPRLRLLADVAMRPRWAARAVSASQPFRMAYANGEGGNDLRLLSRRLIPLGWDDVRRFRDRWKGTFLLKGIMDPADADFAVSAGVDGLIVSNHGGRQLDSAPASLLALTQVVDAVGGRTRVLMDGGVRTGDDILRSLAAGADAVLLGRAVLYGLAARGGAGAWEVLDILKKEFETSLALAGFASVSHVRSDGQNRRGQARPTSTPVVE